MTEGRFVTPFDRAVEYGEHLFGVFPHEEETTYVTGLLHHEGNYFESYVDSGSWRQYPNWVREYQETPLKDALEAFVEEEEMHTTEGCFDGEYYNEQPMESAGLSGWRYKFERKRGFRQSVLRGNTTLGVVALFNKYGDVYSLPGAADYIEERYWEYVDENYEHRHKRFTPGKTQSEQGNS